MILPYLVGIIIALAIGCLLYGIRRSLQPSEDMDRRIDDLAKEYGVGATRQARRMGTVLDRLDQTIAERDFAENIKTDLARADLALTVTEYLLIRAAIVVVLFVVGYSLQRDVLSGLLLGAVAGVLPTVYIRMRQTRRLQAFNGQLPDVLDHLIGSLRAGYGLVQALEWVGRQISNPAGMEFNRVVREVQLGLSLREAFENLLRRIDSDDLALIIIAMNIQYEVGGNLADVLDIVAHSIRERVRILGEIRVMTSQQRYSGYVLMLLPIFLGIVLYIMNPEYESQLFAPGPTLCIPIGAGIMMVLGFLIMRRIVDIDV